MISISLYPTVDHCIETAARNAHLQLQRQVLDTNSPGKEIIARLTLLEEFLSCADFRKLRAASEELLLKGESIEFLIWREAGEVRWKMQSAAPQSTPET